MFVRVKGKEPNRYIQIVENAERAREQAKEYWRPGARRAIGCRGRSGCTAEILESVCHQVQVIDGYRQGSLEAGTLQHIGPDLVFGRLWQAVGIDRVLNALLQDRNFGFPVERAVYLAVLHRLFESGSDRATDKWRRDVRITETESLELHHLYRAMRWLGDHKNTVEESLFQRRRDLFTDLSLAFFDTTSLYFEGQGGESLGQLGYSKDDRPDRRQMIVGGVLTGDGRPVC